MARIESRFKAVLGHSFRDKLECIKTFKTP